MRTQFLLCAFCWIIVDNMSSPPADEDHLQKEEQDWRNWAIGRLWEEREKIGHTPLIKYTVTRNSSTYESSSGNTAAAEAYMYSAIGIPFYAVVSRNLEQAKIDNILGNNGQLIKTDDSTRGQLARDTAARTGGFYVDQHGNAEKAEDFTESGGYGHESGNVFHEVLAQLRDDPKIPRKDVDYFVHCAGTGGTITSVGRYVDRYNLPTKVVLIDTEFSVYYDYVLKNGHKIETSRTPSTPPGVPGVGYPAEAAPAIFGNTTSLASAVIDEVMKIPDIATAAGFREFSARGLRGGPSSAMNILGALEIALKNAKLRREISIVTLLNDPAEFYQNDYFNDTWIDTAFAGRGGLKALDCWRRVIASTLDRGTPFIDNGIRDCKSN